MGIRRIDFAVQTSFDRHLKLLSCVIRYSEEGYDIVLYTDGPVADLKEAFTAVLGTCERIKNGKGEMLPYKIDVFVSSDELTRELQAFKDEAMRMVPLSNGEVVITLTENIVTSVPDLFVGVDSDLAGTGNLNFRKYRRKKIVEA